MFHSVKSTFITYSICVLGIIFALLSIWYGSFLPLRKAQQYITSLRFAQGGFIRNFDDFQNNFNRALQFSSPVGDEEVAKFLSSDIAGLISDPKQPEVVRRTLVEYIAPYMEKNNVRHLITLAGMYRALWSTYKQEADFQSAERYYRDALAIGQKLPPVLYSLLDLYSQKGDMVRTEEIKNKIMSMWDDPRLRTL